MGMSLCVIQCAALKYEDQRFGWLNTLVTKWNKGEHVVPTALTAKIGEKVEIRRWGKVTATLRKGTVVRATGLKIFEGKWPPERSIIVDVTGEDHGKKISCSVNTLSLVDIKPDLSRPDEAITKVTNLADGWHSEGDAAFEESIFPPLPEGTQRTTKNWLVQKRDKKDIRAFNKLKKDLADLQRKRDETVAKLDVRSRYSNKLIRVFERQLKEFEQEIPRISKKIAMDGERIQKLLLTRV